MKIIILIFSCYKYTNRIEKLKNIGYFKELDKYNQIDYYVVRGDETLSDDIKKQNELILKISDTYIGFPMKIIHSIKLIEELYKNDDYILIKTDDDYILNIKFILDNLKLIQKYDYVGSICNEKEENYINNWNGVLNKSKYYGGYMSGENGYVLSKYSVSLITEYCKTDVNHLLEISLYEDKLIGDILRFNNIQCLDLKHWWRNILPTECDTYNNLFKKNGYTHKWDNYTCISPNRQTGMINLFGNNDENTKNMINWNIV